jgi:hypothetical protein
MDAIRSICTCHGVESWTRLASASSPHTRLKMGISTFESFHGTLSAIQRGSFAIAAAGMKAGDWCRQVGAPATHSQRLN